MTGGFELNLASGDITNGSLTVCFGSSGDTCDTSGTQHWTTSSFSGTSSATAGLGILESKSVSGSITINGTDVANPVFSGSIHGFMVDDSASKPGFVLGFNFENDSAASAGNQSTLGAALIEGRYVQTYDSTFRDSYTGYGFAISKGISTQTLGSKRGIVGNAVHGSSSNPSIISFTGDGSLNTPEELFNGEPDLILVSDAATRDSDYSQISVATQTNLDLNWSVWDEEDDNSLYDNIAGGFDNNVFTDNLVVVTTSTPAYITTGTYTFADTTQTDEFTGSASLGELEGLTGSFDVDFSDGSITNGNLKLTLSGAGYDQTWLVNFTGAFETLLDSDSIAHLSYLNGVTIGSTKITDHYDGTATGHTIDGDILGLLTTLAEGGPGFAGGFDLFDVQNTNNNVIGAFLWGNDDFLSSQERLGIAGDSGIFVTGSAKSGEPTGIFGGPAYFNSSAGEEVFTNRTFSESTFDNKINFASSSGTIDKVFRVGDVSATASASSNGLERWGRWESQTIGTDKFKLYQHAATGTSSITTAGEVGYWFIGDHLDANDVPTTGNFSFGGTGIGSGLVALQGSYSYSGSNGSDTPTYEDINVDSASQFSFDLNFSNGDITNGLLNFTAGEEVSWSAGFNGSLVGAFIDASIDTSSGNDITDAFGSSDNSVDGLIQGYLTGDGSVAGAALAFNLTASTFDNIRKHALFGTVLLGSGVEEVDTLELPPLTTDEYSIAWGKWDNPVDENWVVVANDSAGQVQIQTGDHLASVTPTPIANLTGTGNYESTIASSFIGSGSAGDVTQVVAGMAVDFNTGLIANGLLQVEVANSQAWQIDFSGTVNAGLVELNSTSGLLMDPGGIISNSIDANLGGVFTGNNGEAFVGGFELVDQINSLNHVDGIYTIER